MRFFYELSEIRRRAGLTPLKEQLSDEPQIPTERVKFQPGTLLYHGTDSKEFDETNDLPWPGSYFAQDPKIAMAYASWQRSGHYGPQRVVTYRLKEDIDLVPMSSEILDYIIEELGESGAPDWFCPQIDLDTWGWIEPKHEIMLCDSDCLEFVSTYPIPAEMTKNPPEPW